ncbi:Beta-galactosidase [Mariniphaga anaerophila]|uniref:Beta-galactosidase n=1 Tax=Mariniphaga anaerophila TaxID=1484053 RepID=A0A1M5E7J0_9BACT|nr:beta-galactosidase [Mariniphaga anaerophila]SHF75021.1 Beta-galactosidase [Mariniphaga anaerophila]
MKKFLVLYFCFSLLFVSCEKDDVEPEKPDRTEYNYDVLGLGEIATGLWVTPPSGYQTSEEYKRIKECGLNFVNGFHYFENSHSKILKVLDYCEENDLKFFANKASVASGIVNYSKSPDVSLLNKFINEIEPYANHPAFAGELMIDEPGKNLFEAVSAFTKAFDEAYPDKMWHVNLFPTYATGGIQASSYNEYINNWLMTVPSKHISYDSYPLLSTGEIIDDYFYNLDIIRSKSRFRKIPFWTFIQTLSIAGTPGVPDKREPSEADIRWQVWSNLAFGAKGIQYFCYWSPGNGTEQFGEALIGLSGEKTVRYDYVKKINSDINAIGKILLNCHAEGVIQTSVKDYKMYERLNDFGEIRSITGDDNIMGCFENEDGEKKVLITTLTPDKDASVILHLSDKVSEVKVWNNGGSEKQLVSGNQIVFQIDAGEAVFVEF